MLRSVITLSLLALLPLTAGARRVTVRNVSRTAVSRMVEIPAARLGAATVYRVADAGGREVPSQLTHDSLLIFPVSLRPREKAAFEITLNPQHSTLNTTTSTLVYGAVYPNVDDDLSWENDRVGFRAYGPAKLAKHEVLYGYDLWLKRDTAGVVVPGFCAADHDPETWGRIHRLAAGGHKAEADSIVRAISYHVDHGHGMDCYAVGPTLGAGAAALVSGGKIAYPSVYERAEILDNGPLRFTARLTYAPRRVGQDTAVVETRLITLDLGSHLNRTRVSYSGLTAPVEILTGIVIHDDPPRYTAESSTGIIAYTDPTQGADNGLIHIGAIMPATRVETGIREGHVAAWSQYRPGTEYTYYWGFGWDRSDTPTLQDWHQYLLHRRQEMEARVEVRIKN